MAVELVPKIARSIFWSLADYLQFFFFYHYFF